MTWLHQQVCGGDGEAIDKIQHPFMVNIQPTSNGKGCPQPNKGYLEKKLAVNIIVLMNDRMFSSKIKNKTRMLTLSISIQHCT